MKKLITAALAALAIAPAPGFAAGGAMALLDANPDLTDRPSLQRGAGLFANYCLSCHAISFQRYQRMGQDLGLTDEQVAGNLLFAGEKVQEKMTVAMRPDDAEGWFGVAPPDLSVIARARGADWIYSYLVTFYRDPDPARPFGVNNLVFPAAGMPHVLWPLQGYQDYVAAEAPGKVVSESVEKLEAVRDSILVHKSVVLEDGSHATITDRLEPALAGALEPGQFRRAARDIVNFLVYVGEPAQLVRYQIGMWVLAFLLVLIVLTRALYKEYWKDVH